jgi:DNA-binding NarL/FixJ family response regulator
LIGEAGTGPGEVAKPEIFEPQVVLMDIHMPNMKGIEVRRRILAEHPSTRIVMLTMLEGDDLRLAATPGGACGYILKGADKLEVMRTCCGWLRFF